MARSNKKNTFLSPILKRNKIKSSASIFARMGLFPLAFYLVAFCILTFPLVLKFSSHFFSDSFDGLQNVWNIWWVNKAVTQLHQLPWHTSYLYFPFGTSLLAHTMNPFNGFMGIILLKFLTLIQTHNFIVVFSFVVGGFTAFLLAYYLTRSYWGSIIAGFIFTFSNYHFAHAEGHLQLVSLEWIPLFVLCWYVFVTKPSVLVGAASAIVLFAVILCDFYYFFFCVMIACLIFAWYARKKKDAYFIFRRKYIFPLVTFIVGFLVTSAPLIIALLMFSNRNPLIGAHDPKVFCLDLLAPFIPGGHWHFAHLTKFYWSKITGNIHESSVHVGLSVTFVLIYTWINRRKIHVQSLRLWYGVLMFFLILSLGPVLHIWGKEVSLINLPYAYLEVAFPSIKLSGCPVRMMAMTMLSASVIFAMGFKRLFRGGTRKPWLIALLLVILCFEYLPKAQTTTKIAIPEYVKVLKELPNHKGVIDMVSDFYVTMYYQTIHEKPMALGYISRRTRMTEERKKQILQLVNDRQFALLYWRYNFRYLISDDEFIKPSDKVPIKVVFDDGNVKIYDLGATWE